MKTICVDPGHGMSNRHNLVYDSGAEDSGVTEAAIVMDYANTLRNELQKKGFKVVRTRVDDKDPAPVSRRDDIARSYGVVCMISLHCNSGGGTGVEVFYRGGDDEEFAKKLSSIIASSYNIKDRGAKTEKSSQHSSLAVMEFDKCWLVELGFIDNQTDRTRMLSSEYRQLVCVNLAAAIYEKFN